MFLNSIQWQTNKPVQEPAATATSTRKDKVVKPVETTANLQVITARSRLKKLTAAIGKIHGVVINRFHPLNACYG